MTSALARGDDLLNMETAYRAMYRFCVAYYERGVSGDEFPIFLGSLAPGPDSTPMDPAFWDDFLQAVDAEQAGAPL